MLCQNVLVESSSSSGREPGKKRKKKKFCTLEKTRKVINPCKFYKCKIQGHSSLPKIQAANIFFFISHPLTQAAYANNSKHMGVLGKIDSLDGVSYPKARAYLPARNRH